MGEPFAVVVDMKAVLDRSRTGAEASRALESAWSKLSSQRDGSERLETLRTQLRAALTQRAESAIRELATARGAKLVVERGAVLFAVPELDLTAGVIAAVDAQGPLPLP